MLVLGLLYLVKNNRRGLLLTYAIMGVGAALVGLGTLLFDLGAIPPMAWMIAVGLGLYLGYVPYGCVLFDRTIAALEIVATAVFLIYVSDAVAYGGSVGVVLYKTLARRASRSCSSSATSRTRRARSVWCAWCSAAGTFCDARGPCDRGAALPHASRVTGNC